MNRDFYICEPSELKELGFAASELDFLRRELRLGERAVIVLADRSGKLYFLLSSAYKTLGVLMFFVPKTAFSVAPVLEYPDIRREIAISARAASIDEKDGSAIETVSGLLNMDLYIARPKRENSASDVVVRAARFVGIASALCDEKISIEFGDITADPDASGRFDRAAFAVFVLSHIGFKSVLFSGNENGIEVSLKFEKAAPSAELARSLLSNIGLSLESAENELRAHLSRREVSLIGLKQPEPIDF
ncbi:MAG: hypothetical protein E7640_05810 [Ruminococcaceae bacterium]|nr:hypothetical protein [Oscillospiraceae bacterium]